MKHLYLSIALVAVSASIMSQSTRTVLLELSESTWTENNSLIICEKEELKSSFTDDELAVISYHWDDVQNDGDPMYQLFADQWAQTFNVSVWGRGAIDRVSYNGTTMTSLAADNWNDTIAARINRPTDGLVTLPEVLYDPNYDEIFVRTNLLFTDSVFGIINREMRFFLYLVQDGVIADQLVDASNLGSCNIFTPPFDTIEINSVEYLYKKDFSHNDVAIVNPTGVAGTDDIITQQIEIGNQFNDIHTFSKPSGVDLQNLRVVAFVANYDAGDITKNVLINAAQQSTFTTYDKDDVTDPNHPQNPENPNSQFNPNNWPTGVKELGSFDAGLKVSPNPMHGLGIISYEMPRRAKVKVEVIDLQGNTVKSIYEQTLAAGPQRAGLTTDDIPAGVYMVRVRSNDFVAHETMVVVK